MSLAPWVITNCCRSMLITQDAHTHQRDTPERWCDGDIHAPARFNLIIRGAVRQNENNIHNTTGSEKIFIFLEEGSLTYNSWRPLWCQMWFWFNQSENIQRLGPLSAPPCGVFVLPDLGVNYSSFTMNTGGLLQSPPFNCLDNNLHFSPVYKPKTDKPHLGKGDISCQRSSFL